MTPTSPEVLPILKISGTVFWGKEELSRADDMRDFNDVGDDKSVDQAQNRYVEAE
jgi:hypothetical protein